jgi:uncharacterized protein (TIGR03086 family)
MSSTDPLANLAAAAGQAGDVIAAVRDDQWTRPTPCNEWDVTALVDHVVQSLRNGAIRARGGKPDWTAQAPHAADPIGEYRAAADALIESWRGAGDLSGSTELPGMGEMPARFPVDQLTAELAVHTWDVARATGQSTELDPQVGETALTWAQGVLRPQMRGDAFGPEVPVDPDAPLYDRLAGFFGRDPS